ncbi:acid phosphatase [Stakelama sp. CBK3Z-3]|uniref:Acid phosphatase n=2 Tax=Stakelama flava TaxID=2860338 RepID=A0ABS6XMG8_9SPHN|nr:HAD family acid phosphatase [Stakelama flava]MBW4331404.1 acid phosphatase [Stakelama flava]
MQFLYGSGEAAALSRQAYAGLTDYVLDSVERYESGQPVRSALLAPGATLADPQWRECKAGRPVAIVLDVDETTLLNLGFESDAAAGNAFTPERWSEWEQTGGDKVAPVPGVAEALNSARAHGVTVIFNTNRSTANADATGAMLDRAGLGPAVPGKTLFTKAAGEHGKDGRRATIASRYCVIAMVGDQLGDFSDLFEAPSLSVGERRAAASSPAIAALWGKGWFLLPNPVYGSSLKGGVNDIFPTDKRWSPRTSGSKE